MAHSITSHCVQCSNCIPECPTGAIRVEGDSLWIDPMLCNDCKGYAEIPQCISVCPIDTPPVPLKAKKGRCKGSSSVVTSPDLFPNRKSNPFASSIVVWEACNILAQRHLPIEVGDRSDSFQYQRQVNGGRGTITFRISNSAEAAPIALDPATARAEIARWDVRAACMHLIYAAHITALDQPWDQTFSISDQQISTYLGLDKRKDLSKLAKLTLIKELALQPCKLLVSVDWSQQGRIRGTSIPESRVWHLLEIHHHFQEDEAGCKHLSGLTFTIKAGQWTHFFLNHKGIKQGTAFYQYGNLPKSLISNTMSIWQQHEGAARMMLWLLFKVRIGAEQRITVPTLMRIAYGQERVNQASIHREERKRLLRTFEGDLEVLNQLGLSPIFDPVTYPPDIQPLWVKLAEMPDDAEAAIEFWINDGSRVTRLTDAAPRDKWNRLMHARLQCFKLPEDWGQRSPKSTKKRTKRNKTINSKFSSALSGQQISAARKRLQLSQRALADQLGKSQSWVRDIENGRLQVSEKDQALLSKVLNLVRNQQDSLAQRQ